MVKVSVVVPVCNVDKYLKKCLDSIKNQTLTDIEVIIVNDGSKDSSGSICNEYAAKIIYRKGYVDPKNPDVVHDKDVEVINADDGTKDKRFTVIHKPNSGYGASMNVGFSAAKGEYIGIIESDDYADPDMYQRLYEIAVKNKCEVVKSNFYAYFSSIEPEIKFFENYGRHICGKVLSPSAGLKEQKKPAGSKELNKSAASKELNKSAGLKKNDKPVGLEGHDLIAFWNAKPSIWSGIYLRSFVEKNHITFNETPGASYQDTSFMFKVWGCAERVFVTYAAFLNYRQDSTGSSVNNTGKIYCVCDEYAEIEKFIDEKPERAPLYPLMNRIKLDTYLWNMERIADQYVPEFAVKAAEEFTASAVKGHINKKMFEPWKWDSLIRLSRFPRDFANQMIVEKAGRETNIRLDRIENKINDIGGATNQIWGIRDSVNRSNESMYRIESMNMPKGLRKKMRTFVWVLRHEGVGGVVRVIKEKMRHR